MFEVPRVISRNELSNSFLGDLIQVCIVTSDYRRTVEGLLKLGIGPWRTRTFDERNVSQRTYRGKPSAYSMKICAADSKNMNWEVIQPLQGPSIHMEFLERHGDGVQHLAFNCTGTSYQDRLRKLSAAGYEIIQSGVFKDTVRFDYLENPAEGKIVLEIFDIPENFAFPEPEEWIPGPPPR